MEGRVLRPALFTLPLGPARRFVAEHIGTEIVFIVYGPAVFDTHDAPDATLQDFAVVAHVFRRHHEWLDRKVGERRHVDVFVLVELCRHLVDDGVLTQLTDLGLDAFRLVGTHVVLAQDLAYALEPFFDGNVVVRRAVHAQQVLEHERGNIGAALHKRRQILANDLATEMLKQLGVERIHLVDRIGRFLMIGSSGGIVRINGIGYRLRRHRHPLRLGRNAIV